jgi:peptide/nickel transport system substrate-binding protein
LDDTVTRVDARSGAVTKTVPVGGAPTGIAVGDGSVWVTNAAEATVSRIDSSTGSVTQTIHTGNGPRAIAVDASGAWVANDLDATVSRIATASNSVTSTVQVGAGPAGISLAAGSVWVVNRYGRSVAQIGAAAGTLTRTVALGNAPQAITVVGGRLWVAVSNASSAHRGGTLNVLSGDSGPDSIDPAVGYDPVSWQMLWMTNDGLVGFERTGGAEGATLVPDLATSLPAPTDGGRTYTFRIRPGIKYSNGIPVRASDMPATIERDFRSSSPGTGYFQGIVGADACMKSPASCRLPNGIIADDVSGTVVFHLGTPDPEFLAKLALPFAYFLPKGTPNAAPQGKEKPLPATGPYRISSYTAKRGIVFTRNPNFKEWAPAAQPGGYPDRIDWKFGVPGQQGVDLVERDAADWFFGDLPTDRLAELQTRFAGQTHPYTQATTWYVALNTRSAPFDDLRVRRALNFAVDRNHLAELLGGTTQAEISCQILPPNFPGYHPYCPYTIHPNPTGAWSGPDLAQARRLVRASGMAGTPVVVWSTSDPSVPFVSRIGPYLVDVLRSLGFRSSLHSVPSAQTYFSRLYDGMFPFQIAASGWIADYLSASSFIEPQLTCRSYVRGSMQNGNAARFCDPAIDARARDADQTEQTDPAAAAEKWAAIDRAITDEAPYLVLANPVGIDILSKRVGNYQRHPQWGLLLDQLWVR